MTKQQLFQALLNYAVLLWLAVYRCSFQLAVGSKVPEVVKSNAKGAV